MTCWKASDQFIAWEGEQETWLDTEAFWSSLSPSESRGRIWPSSTRLPTVRE